MKYLPPLLACLLAFFAARHFRTAYEAPGAGFKLPDLPGMFGKRSEPRGLARQTERLAARDFGSIASLDRLHRSGALSGHDRRNAIREAAERDPAGTWEWIEENYPLQEKYHFLQIVAPVWFNADPAAALARLSTVDFYQRSRLAGDLIGKLADGSPNEKSAVATHLDPLVEFAGISISDIRLPELSPAGAEPLMALPEGRSRDILLQQFVFKWLSQDFASASVWLRQLPETLRTSAMEKFATSALNEHSGTKTETRNAAIAWLRDEAPVAIRKRLGTSLASAIAEADPKAAMEWAGQNLSSRQLADATKGIVAKLVTKDLPAARGMVEELPPGNGRNLAAASIAEHWIKTAPVAAMHWWLANTGEDHLKDDAYFGTSAGMGSAWVETDPQSFRDYLADPASAELPPATVNGAVGQLIKDREGTFDWIATLPDDRREPVLKTAYLRWALDSPAEAAAAFDSRPELATGDGARQIAYYWYRADPSAAAGWVANLPWGGLRESAISGLRKMADYQTQSGSAVPEEVRQLLR
jgi:hypothetical protein